LTPIYRLAGRRGWTWYFRWSDRVKEFLFRASLR
jgi:hypothetical protein